MSYKIYIENVKTASLVELKAIGSDVIRPTFKSASTSTITTSDTSINESNDRLADANAFAALCAKYIGGQVFLIYRGVAAGGLQRGLGGFSSKPLTVKYKSIDPSLIADNDDFKRLSGLVPIQIRLGKKGDSRNSAFIAPADGQQSYSVVKVDGVGNTKTYLCCGNVDRILSWEKTMTPTGKTLCTFLGDTSNPYLADWDLVLVGVKPKITADLSTKTFFAVVEKSDASGVHNILPQWLLDCLGQQKTPLNSHVTQHGPESLYCGNDITQADEEFIVITYNADSKSEPGTTKVITQDSESKESPWDLLTAYVPKTFRGYFIYAFDEFNGKPVANLVPATLIAKLNLKLKLSVPVTV